MVANKILMDHLMLLQPVLPLQLNPYFIASKKIQEGDHDEGSSMAADVIFWFQGSSVAREDLPTEKVIGKQSGLNPL